jgi:DNA invertase Pin-like site-specific DNA recombinase
MKIGYARVSTIDQNLDLQLDNLKQAGCEKIYIDKITGTKFDRPELLEMQKVLREGDTIIVWKLDRVGRGLRDLIRLMDGWKANGIGFKSLTEGIDTTTPAGNLMFQIFGCLAEYERSLIVERTQAGLKAGRARGKVGGRPRKLDDGQRELLRKMHADKTIPLSVITDTFGISRPMIYKVLGEVKEK